MHTQGILVGFDNLDGVIRIIREASSNSIAAAGLQNGELLILSLFINFHCSKLSPRNMEFQDMILRGYLLRCCCSVGNYYSSVF